mgnify:CR=1 FL=1
MHHDHEEMNENRMVFYERLYNMYQDKYSCFDTLVPSITGILVVNKVKLLVVPEVKVTA